MSVFGVMMKACYTFALVMMAVTAQAEGMGDRFVQSFVGQPELKPQELQLIGGDAPSRYCKIDAAGLRCRVPDNDPAVSFCGLEARFVVRGDFEITAGYQILDLPRPKGGQGAGLKISIKDHRKEGASLQRLRSEHAGHVYSAHRAKVKGDEHEHTSDVKPTRATSGRLRLRREGTILHYLVADGDSDQFVELRQAEFSDGDLSQLYFAAQTGGSPTLVDVAWSDLEVRADQLVRPYQAQEGSGTWLIVLFGTGAVLLIVVAVVWQRLNARRAMPRRHQVTPPRKK